MDDDIELELNKMEDLVQYTVEKAQELGANEARAKINKATGLSVSSRNTEMENISFTNGRSLAITVYKDDRKGTVGTSDLSRKAIDESISAALSIAKHTDPDPDARLPERQYLAFEKMDFDTFHPLDIEPNDMFERCKNLELKTMAADERVISVVSAKENSGLYISAMATTQGLVVSSADTSYSRNLVLMCGKDDDRQYGGSYTYDSRHDKLWSDELLVKEAIDEGVSQLCPQKIKTGDYPVIFDVNKSSLLLNVLFSALDGHTQYYKTGFLTDSLNKRVLPEWISIDENPHIVGKMSSCYMDGDGVRTSPMSIIKHGCVQNYFLNNYFANKLKMANNAHNRGVSNTFVVDERGALCSKNDLIRQMDRGIIVHDTMGSGIKLINGELSIGASGFYVENGVIQYPIAEFTIAGNFKDLFNGIVAIADDGDSRNVADLGSVLIEKIKVAGG